jgi:hypothetical protein
MVIGAGIVGYAMSNLPPAREAEYDDNINFMGALLGAGLLETVGIGTGVVSIIYGVKHSRAQRGRHRDFSYREDPLEKQRSRYRSAKKWGY